MIYLPINKRYKAGKLSDELLAVVGSGHSITADGVVVLLDTQNPILAQQIIDAHNSNLNLQEQLDDLRFTLRKLAATIKAFKLIYDAMPANIKPALPQWVTDELTDALQKINQAGG